MTAKHHYGSPSDMPRALRVLPVMGVLLIPRGQIELKLERPGEIALIDDALGTNRLVGLCQASASNRGDVGKTRVGCAGRLTKFAELDDGVRLVTLTGVARFGIVRELISTTCYRECEVDFAEFASDFSPRSGEDCVDRAALVEAVHQFVSVFPQHVDWRGIEDAPSEALVNGLAMLCPFGARGKQALLEAEDLKSRAELLVTLVKEEVEKAASAGTAQRAPVLRIQHAGSGAPVYANGLGGTDKTTRVVEDDYDDHGARLEGRVLDLYAQNAGYHSFAEYAADRFRRGDWLYCTISPPQNQFVVDDGSYDTEEDALKNASDIREVRHVTAFDVRVQARLDSGRIVRQISRHLSADDRGLHRSDDRLSGKP
jgi:Lon protease-like protein